VTAEDAAVAAAVAAVFAAAAAAAVFAVAVAVVGCREAVLLRGVMRHLL
jgi:hypothetical protein